MPNSSRNNQETKTGTILLILFEKVLVKVGDCPMMDKNAMPGPWRKKALDYRRDF
jgi:hypothetical protein